MWQNWPTQGFICQALSVSILLRYHLNRQAAQFLAIRHETLSALCPAWSTCSPVSKTRKVWGPLPCKKISMEKAQVGNGLQDERSSHRLTSLITYYCPFYFVLFSSITCSDNSALFRTGCGPTWQRVWTASLPWWTGCWKKTTPAWKRVKMSLQQKMARCCIQVVSNPPSFFNSFLIMDKSK